MFAHINSTTAATARSPHAAICLEHAANGYVTEDEKLNDLLGLRSRATVEDIIKVALLNRVKDVTSNKRIRGKLVTLQP